MEEGTQSKSKGKKVSIVILSILGVISLYTVFRFTVGGYFIQQIDSFLKEKYTSSNGLILSEISLGSSSLYDQKSTLSSISNNVLSGTTGIETTDPRVIAMEKFLIDYNSPMYPYAKDFIEQASKYKLDWRLVASISGVESAFGTILPGKANNGWGWRGGPNGEYSEFKSWTEGITTVTRRLATGYGTTLTPFDIERNYCPPCYANPAHAWANGVVKFENELSYYLNNLEKI